MASQVGDLSEVSPMLVRPSYEDLLGAGSIVAAFGERVRQSVEASMAAAVFEFHRDRLAMFLESCISGRELVERGFGADVVLAAEVDTRSGVPERRFGDPAKKFTNQAN